jgi:NAD(P)-dependent dehydrogenase (short-subunit alcohol dehydrogenase family)
MGSLALRHPASWSAGQPYELAAMGLFLASDEASYVNGQPIPVDGSLTASMQYAGKPI